MRKNVVLLLLVTCFANMLLQQGYALDAKIITVAKSGGDHKSISKALSAITNASNSNRFIIKVMPGIYEESIKMKPYVDIVGSGQENTRITSSSEYTVMGADNSSLENIWVDSTEAVHARYHPSAILVDGGSMSINNVKVTMNNPVPPLTQAFGIQTRGPASKPVISNCTVHVRGKNQRGLIGIGGAGSGGEGSSPVVTNCDITVDTTGAEKSFWNVGIRTRDGNSSIKNSTIMVKGADYNQGIEGAKQVQGTKIKLIATPNTVSNLGVEWATVIDSEIIIEGVARKANCAVSAYSKVERSLIDGAVCDDKSKIVNSRDKNNKPIPNQ